MLKKNFIVTKNDFMDRILENKTLSINANYDVKSLIDTSISLYQESSVFEDSVLEKYLGLYSLVKNIEFNKKLNYIFTESFISESYFDKDFHIDNKLNIDILNGDATLPIISSDNINVASIIIENTSNGYAGSSLDGQKYDNINDILSEDSSKLFIYEKIASMLSITELKLDLSLKFAKEEICNSLYLKLYVDGDMRYPEINSIKISKDGIEYKDINIEVETNKADIYIRFAPENIRYISISFRQSTYNNIDTNFGSRYRYSIGIRQITPEAVIYSNSGEYVSIPLSVPKNINSLYFNVKDIANNDIKYLISANNGSRWYELSTTDLNVLINSKLGLDILDDIVSIRIKVLMDKSNIKFGIKNNSEFLPESISNKYYLKYKPLTTNIYLGNHISYGNKSPYVIPLNTHPASGIVTIPLDYIPYSSLIFDSQTGYISNLIIEMGGTPLSPSSFTIEEAGYPEHSLLKIQAGYITSDTMTIYYKSLIFNGTVSNTYTLPQKLFIKDDNNSVFVGMLDNEGNLTKILKSDEYTIIDNTSIKINDASYNNQSLYVIMYSPEVKISDTSYISNNEVSIPSMKNTTTFNTLRFDYKYETDEDLTIIKYYTPICKEYRVSYT